MEYTIKALADLAGVTTRTLRWYDQTGLLKPCRIQPNGYRIYGSAEVDRLQQILFYRALGVELAQVKRLLDDPAFDRTAALRGHLIALSAERDRIDALIGTVARTLDAEERKEFMTDREKFEAFKQRTVSQNEAAYGAEIRAKYGDKTIDAANARALALTPEEYNTWKQLGDEIGARLTAAVRAGASPDGPEGKAVAELHRQWLGFSWDTYTAAAHRGLAHMYPADERFCAYYDSEAPGCAQFLCDAVQRWISD
ncbi:MAG: MerR family transcriptional regulator [Butyricicoccus sp.]|nr:MerR family transcriptional regulator [Butyricicoccus sp.]